MSVAYTVGKLRLLSQRRAFQRKVPSIPQSAVLWDLETSRYFQRIESQWTLALFTRRQHGVPTARA